jgi:hypothetical protein
MMAINSQSQRFSDINLLVVWQRHGAPTELGRRVTRVAACFPGVNSGGESEREFFPHLWELVMVRGMHGISEVERSLFPNRDLQEPTLKVGCGKEVEAVQNTPSDDHCIPRVPIPPPRGEPRVSMSLSGGPWNIDVFRLEFSLNALPLLPKTQIEFPTFEITSLPVASATGNISSTMGIARA